MGFLWKGKNMITGIYEITNLVNNKKYIGQSKKVPGRWNDHIRIAFIDQNLLKNKTDIRDYKLPIHNAMRKYGVENFSFRILEFCEQDDLNIREQFWIEKLKTNQPDYGYNLTPGGQKNFQVNGERHGMAKLTQAQVDDIIMMLQDKKDNNEILSKYPFISRGMIANINQGKNWKKEGIEYPIVNDRALQANIASHQKRRVFSPDQIITIRKLYANGKTLTEITDIFNNIVSISMIKSIVYGESYKDIPLFKAKEQKWIEPCIDYSQGYDWSGEVETLNEEMRQRSR